MQHNALRAKCAHMQSWAVGAEAEFSLLTATKLCLMVRQAPQEPLLRAAALFGTKLQWTSLGQLEPFKVLCL